MKKANFELQERLQDVTADQIQKEQLAREVFGMEL
jgi:hypothetical protein